MNVKLKSNVKHNGERFEAGQTIENIDDTSGQILIDSGVAEAIKVAKTTEKTVEPKTDEKKPVEKMNKAELLAEAEARGVDVPEGATNKEIVALLKGE